MAILSSPVPVTLERPPLEVARRGEVARLLVRCPDHPGVTAAIGAFLSERGADIISLDQHFTGYPGGEFFQRTVFHLPEFDLRREAFEIEFQLRVANARQMTWSLSAASTQKRVAIMVSKRDHCLLDLLWHTRRKESPVSVGAVISNHLDLEQQVRSFGVPFTHIPVKRDAKPEAEAQQLQLLRGNFDLV